MNTDEIAVNDVIERLQAAADSGALTSAALAAELLSHLPPTQMLRVETGVVDTLRKIYTRRAERPNSAPDVHELADRLQRVSAATLQMVVTPIDGHVVSVWFDDGLTSLVACLVGVDRRVATSDD